jgi:hypothetical protein
MVRHQFPVIITILLAASALLLSRSAYGYQHFKVAVYARAYEVREMADPAWLESHWDALSRQVHVDKIYLETHRASFVSGVPGGRRIARFGSVSRMSFQLVPGGRPQPRERRTD